MTHLLILQEANISGDLEAEVAARVAGEGIAHLDSPVSRRSESWRLPRCRKPLSKVEAVVATALEPSASTNRHAFNTA